MSDGFPHGMDEQHPPPLTQATFTACYHSLAKLIDEETSHPAGKYGGALSVSDRHYAYGELGYWYKHASDGDLGALPTFSSAPWNDLDLIKDEIGEKDIGLLEVDVVTIREKWRGDNGDKAQANVQTMHRKVSQYSVEPTANSHGDGSYIAQVSGLAHAAYAARAAYKKDLYEIAKGAHGAIKGIDDFVRPAEAIGLLTLAIGGIAISSYGAIIAGAGKIFGEVFLSNVVSQAGSLVFQKATSKLDISGDTPGKIMGAASAAVNKAIDNYKQACQNISAGMDLVWNQLDNDYGTIPRDLNS